MPNLNCKQRSRQGYFRTRLACQERANQKRRQSTERDNRTKQNIDGLKMGKQINYWLKYEEFLQIAQAALDCGCVIIKPDSEEIRYGQTLDIITEDKCLYYFYVPEAGSLMAQQIPFQSGQMTGYNAAGNTVIEAGFSFIHDKEKEITRSRLFVISGYYDETGEYIARPECLTRTYQKLVRIVKRIAPYTEITDRIISTNNNDYLQEKRMET